jgi:hypothetical protein
MLRSLFDELLYLPGIDTTLQLRPGILTPTQEVPSGRSGTTVPPCPMSPSADTS